MIERPPHERRNFLRRVLVAAGAAALLCGGFGIDRDEYDCEQAVAHLNDCCPSFDPARLSCARGCDGAGPDLTVDQSACIIGAHCDKLVSSGVCATPTQVYCK